MKEKIFSAAFLFILLFGASTRVFAQPGWKWPAGQEEKAQEKNALYTDAKNQGNFRKAANNLSWLLTNAPDVNASIYINGIQIYDELATAEKDPTKKAMLEDSVMTLYDLRIKYFDNEAYVLNRKAFDAYKYFKDDQKRYKELNDLFKKTFELNGANVMPNNVLAYMDVVRRYKLSGGAMTDDQVMDVYDQLSDIVSKKLEKKPDDAMLKDIQDKLDGLLLATIKVDCDFVKNVLGPKLQQKPDDLKIAKNIFRLSLAGKCLDLDVALEAAKVVQKHDPEYGVARFIGKSCASNDNVDCAVQYLEQSVTLTDDNSKKADSYYDLAVLMARQKKKVDARNYARKALAADPSKKEAHKLIGDLYMGSFNDCKEGKDMVHDRGVYLAAYQEYRLAGDAQGMANAKEQFPSMEDIFTNNLEVGQTFKVGCWINETVTIQKR